MKITIETNLERVVIETNEEEIDVVRTQLTSCCSRGHEGTSGPQGIPSPTFAPHPDWEDKTSENGGV